MPLSRLADSVFNMFGNVASVVTPVVIGCLVAKTFPRSSEMSST
jgi:hypothetical protein